MTSIQSKLAGLGVTSVLMPFLCVAMLPLIVFYAWTEQLLWNWFVAGYLHLQPIALLPMVGVAMLITLLTGDRRVFKGQEALNRATFAANISTHTFALVFGYILHRFFVR